MSALNNDLKKALNRSLRVAGALALAFALAVGGRTAWNVERIIHADPEGRPLTTGEIANARQIFGNKIDYGRVRIHHAPKTGALALTLGNDIYIEGAPGYIRDFSAPGAHSRQLLAHEMTHVWQNENQDLRMTLLQSLRTIPGRFLYFAFNNADGYKYGADMKFSDGSEEQQAKMVETYVTMQVNLASPRCDAAQGGDEQNRVCRNAKQTMTSLASRIHPSLPGI